MDTAYQIERLLQFGQKHGLISELDVLFARNTLLDLFHLEAPCTIPVAEEIPDLPTEILDTLLDEAAEKGLYDSEVNQFRINFEARIMGALMPRESECCSKFANLLAKNGAKSATDWFYRLCIESNYIRTAQIAQNIKWSTSTSYGDLEITINMTKPEKDPKTIALERLQPKSGYPTCMLCRENIGYAGRVNFPARQNHRIIPVALAGDPFYLQYSPYVYFNEHCIIFHRNHIPMEMNEHTLDQIFSFVEQFPHYTCGSNADLPIVGGSILTHSHFQGGSYTFPMTRATTNRSVYCPDFPNVQAGILNWPVSTVRLIGSDAQTVKTAAARLLHTWQSWSDESVNIIAYTGNTPHNTVTPILHKNANDEFVMDIALRNNRTSAEYPDGIFHPHSQWHNIKKENIGLIEVMGLAILPSRLKQQSTAICEILAGTAADTSCEPDSPLAVHANWIRFLLQKYGTGLAPEQAADAVRYEIGIVFSHVLEDTGVFKQNNDGKLAFMRFLSAAGFAEQP